MSYLDDYEGEMAHKKHSDREIGRLLSGNDPGSGLATLLEMLRDRNVQEVSDGEVAAFARQAAEIVRSADASVSGQRAVVRVKRSRFLRPRLATTLALALSLAGMTGVAIASDDAAPGDLLYGLDRALEVIGIGNGGAAERIAEAQGLFEGGLVSEALAHAASAVDQADVGNVPEESSQSGDALREAANAVTSTDQGNADEVRTKVAELLDWMATNATSEEQLFGSEFGEMVAGFARGISAQADDDPTEDGETEVSPGPPEGVPGGPPEGVTPGPPTNIPPRP
ncbi:MAG TPA: hypothetical protein VFY46_06130 [Acidimicrobiia bacterium]|nr:hypothetical protein [Acidimicrobiia bacterium]